MKSFKLFLTEDIHPQTDEYGSSVSIHNPHKTSDTDSFSDKNKTATFAVNSKSEIGTLANHKFESWDDHPKSNDDWNALHDSAIHEPPLHNPLNKKIATGLIIHTDDNRVVVAHPTNGFGGYNATFPKGKLDTGLTNQANAIKEAFEETGLHAKITNHAVDSDRSTSVTRYYHAKLVGGHPKDMGWESQAVSFVPKHKLKDILNQPVDHKIVDQM